MLILGVENRVPNQCWSSVGLVHSSKEPTSLLWAKAIPAFFYKHQPACKSEVIPALYPSYLLFLIPLWPVAKFGYVLLWMIANPPTYLPTYLPTSHIWKRKNNDHHLPPILHHLIKVVKISLVVKLKSNKGYFEAPSKPELGSSWLALITSGSHSNKYIRSVPSLVLHKTKSSYVVFVGQKYSSFWGCQNLKKINK